MNILFTLVSIRVCQGATVYTHSLPYVEVLHISFGLLHPVPGSPLQGHPHHLFCIPAPQHRCPPCHAVVLLTLLGLPMPHSKSTLQLDCPPLPALVLLLCSKPPSSPCAGSDIRPPPHVDRPPSYSRWTLTSHSGISPYLALSPT